MQLAAPGLEYVPLGHAAQSSSVGVPGASEYVPARHTVHASSSEPRPSPSPNLPGGQEMHTDALPDAKLPLGQGAHASRDDPPWTGLYVPFAHGVQTKAEVAPTVGEYVPGGHCEHCSTPCFASPAPSGR